MTSKAILVICLTVVWSHLSFGVENVSETVPQKHVICSSCHCDPKSNTLNCANMNLFNLFSNDDWIIWVASENSAENIRFDNNGISMVPAFPPLKIRYLSFRHNVITKFAHKAFKNLTLLEHLDLSFNKISSEELTPDIFEGKYAAENYEPLKNLKILNLGNNRLHTLNPDIFEHLPNLEQLSLDSNPFMAIDHGSAIALSNLNKLKFLDLSYLELKTLPEYLFHSPRQLSSLNLTGNLFKTLPQALEFAVNLVELVLDENTIEDISSNNVFPALLKLESLSISYMETLKTIGYGAFSNLPALQKFMCTNNPHLSTIHEHAFSRPGKQNKAREEYPPIRQLLLHNNNLSTISHQLLGRWDEVEAIDIRLNPWKCDCENQWMVDSLVPQIRNTTPTLLNQIVCDHPSEMIGIELYEIFHKNHHMRCSDFYGNHPERDGAILIGILVGLLIGIPLALGIILIYKRGCFGSLGYGPGPADYSRAFYKRAGNQEDLNI